MASGGQWRNRWPLAVIAALILVAGVVLLATHGRTGDFTVHGSMSLVGTDNFASFGDNCAGSAGYDDLRDGAEVVISENGGKTVAVGTLEGSHSADGECLFRFDISGVPSGKGFYGILITHRGVVQFSEREMRDGPALTIGAGS